MNILPLSDLHFEWNSGRTMPDFLSEKYADIVLLTGDIGNKYVLIEAAKHCAELGYIVFVVDGNHDHYGETTIEENRLFFKEELSKIKNAYFLNSLDGLYVDIGGFRFIGTTLWTPLDTSSMSEPVDFFVSKKFRMTDDYLKIPSLNQENFRDRHFKEKLALKGMIEESPLPVVVLTHYPPTVECIHHFFRVTDPVSNCLFHANCPELVTEKVKFWFSGHVHHSVNIDNKIIINPYGYHDLGKSNPSFNLYKTYSLE